MALRKKIHRPVGCRSYLNGHAPAFSTTSDQVAIGEIVLNHQQALACELRLGILPGRGHQRRRAPRADSKMENRPFPGLALDPNLSAHEFDQAFRNREAKASAAVMARSGRIQLLK